MAHDHRVLFVHQSAELYGSDRVLLLLVMALKARGDVEPIVVLPDTGPLHDELSRSGIEVHTASVAKISRAMFSPRGLLNMVGALRQGVRDLDRITAGRPVAVVHSNTLAVMSGALWAWWRKVPHLWHVHEILLSPKLVSAGLPRLVNLLSEGVMANSHPTRQWLTQIAPGLKKKCRIVFNGLPPVTLPQPDAVRAFREKIGAYPGEVVVTLVGRINRMKGQEVLVEAIGLLKARGVLDGTRFAIVGSPAPQCDHLVAALQQQIESLDLSPIVSMLGFDADVWPIWFGSDIAVVPSTEPESFGMVAIEAMAAGLPVVATGHGGILDIVVDGHTGLLVPPRDSHALADALQRLITDPGMRQRMGAEGLERQGRQFSLNTQAEQTAAIYHELVLRQSALDDPCATS